MASKYGGSETGSKYGGEPAGEREISKPRQFAFKLAQGATFGFADEIAAAMVGGMAAMTGYKFKDAYDFALNNIRADDKAYEKQSPKAALTAELAGGVTSGGIAGARLLGKGALEGVSTVAKYGKIAALGGAEGAAYGAGNADQDRGEGALKGFLVGAIAAPVGAKLMDLAVRGIGATASFAARKLGDTPRDQAIRAIRAAAQAEGIDADDAARMLDDLGPQATIADLGENFRAMARAATDQAGAFKTEARNLMSVRQLGQQQRLLDAAEVAAGQKAGNFGVARRALIESRKASAAPLYESAFLKDIKLTQNLTKILTRPDMKSAMGKAQRMAMNEGDDVGDNLLKRIHYAKMDLDDRIGAAIRAGSSNRARILTTLKNDLLKEVDSLSPDYGEARQVFSGDSRMLSAMDKGMELFKLSADEMSEALGGMTKSEQDLFKLGAVRAISDELDKTGMGHDATRKFVNTKAVRDKLGMIFPEPEEFIKKALAEQEFSRTRQILTGGSPTAERLMGQEALSSSIQPEMITSLVSGDPIAAGRTLLSVFIKKKVTPETVNELANMMLEQGATPAQIKRIFATPAFRESIGSAYNKVVVPALAGMNAPVANTFMQERPRD